MHCTTQGYCTINYAKFLINKSKIYYRLGLEFLKAVTLQFQGRLIKLSLLDYQTPISLTTDTV